MDQPSSQHQPVASTERDPSTHHSAWLGRLPRRSQGSGRPSFASHKRLFTSQGTSRRPQISGPSDFRHVQTGSIEFPPADSVTPSPPRRQRDIPARVSSNFRPLELSMYMSDDHMSPMLPHFEFPVPPPPAYVPNSFDDAHQLVRQRSLSSMSFHIPRKPGPASTTSADQCEVPPLIPPKAKARARANTSPEVEMLKERVASAMLEVERLQQKIDDVIERQSIYACSRPSTAHSMARTMSGKHP